MNGRHLPELVGSAAWAGGRIDGGSGASWLDTTSSSGQLDPAPSRYDDTAGAPIYYPRPVTEPVVGRPALLPPLPPPHNGQPGPALIPPAALPPPHSAPPDSHSFPAADAMPPLATTPGSGAGSGIGIDAGEAAALAAFFAADVLSWDETNPQRWYEVVGRYLPGIDPRRLRWWDGHGRQRVDFALPGRITHHGPHRVMVEIRVRITPYTRNPRAPDTPTAPTYQPPLPDAVAATAPAPAAAGWRGLDAYSTRLHVPIRATHTGALVIDIAAITGITNPEARP